MNADKQWRQYNIYHKRKTQQHTPGVYKALQAQLNYFQQTRQIDSIPITPVAEQLKTIYIDTGPLWAFQTYLNIMRDAGLKKPPGKDFNPVEITKIRMPIGFHRTFIESITNFFKVDFLNTATDITNTTKEFIRQSLTAGYNAGEDLNFIINGIMNDGFTKTRAALIARTEVAKASNYGEQAGTDKTGLQTQKEWLSVRDNRTRRDHLATDGQIVQDGKPFDVGLEHYHMQRPGASVTTEGLSVPAKEICNCRCTVGRHVDRDENGVPIIKPGFDE